MNNITATLQAIWTELQTVFQLALVEDNRWRQILMGLGNTLIITVGAIALGLVIGLLVAVVRVSHAYTGKLKILDRICSIYLTIIRGIPMMVLLLITYYIIFASVNINTLLIAVIAFGINSGAYTAEVFRSGIMAVDRGQMEAGRSLGLSYTSTMWYIILPQAIKNILPAMLNEFIALFKETAIVGYIPVQDLTKAAFIIIGITYEPIGPLLLTAFIYLLGVILLTALMSALERRMRASDKR